MENYKISLKEAKDLLQINIENLGFELSKRKTFTYEINKEASIQKAQTSFMRASKFIRFVESIV